APERWPGNVRGRRIGGGASESGFRCATASSGQKCRYEEQGEATQPAVVAVQSMQEAVRLISLERSAACRHILVCLRCGYGWKSSSETPDQSPQTVEGRHGAVQAGGGCRCELVNHAIWRRCFYLLLCIGAGPVTNAVSGPPSVRRDRFE